MPGGGPLALEIVADGERSRFLIRSRSKPQQRQLRGQVGAAYPQAALHSLDWTTLPNGDPLQLGDNEQSLVVRCDSGLASIFRFERTRTATWTRMRALAQTDPLLGVLGALQIFRLAGVR